MILNVNRLLHTPGASQDFHFEMDLSDLEFGGEKPVVRPVVVDGRVYNQAGVLLCELQASTTLRCVCDRCMEEFDAPKSASFSCVLAQEKQDMENDDIVLLDHDEVDLADLAGTAFILDMDTKTLCSEDCKAKCYGTNLATGELVNVGEAVGIIAAQSIGEPGTQLTMRTFHAGGVASGSDITQGLPRVEELFEARRPKGLAIISEIGGTITVTESKRKREVTVANDQTGEAKTYTIPYGSSIKVHDGDVIGAGDELTMGSVNPNDILHIRGPHAVQVYIAREVQRTYRMQGVDINDKHVEVITRQMLRKVRDEEAGETDLLIGSLVDKFELEEANERVKEKGGTEFATASPVLLGITKASLATESFLSAASFQETTKVLTDAAIKGKVDPLLGLKENVIIGKLIPAGTGMSMYKDINITIDGEEVDNEEIE